MIKRKTSSAHSKQVISPFSALQKRRLQFSLRTMLLLMAVAAICSTSLVLGLRTPEVRQELASWTGANIPAQESSGQLPQLSFSLLCYCSPLMLALVVQLTNRLVAWVNLASEQRIANSPDDPFADDGPN